MEEIVDHHRLVDVEFEVALAAADADCSVIPNHLTTDHRHGFGLCWIDLARHDTRPWFVGRKGQFSESAAGSRTHPSDVIGNLHQARSERV